MVDYFSLMFGGVFVVAGMLLMAVNVYKTIRTPKEAFAGEPQAQAA